jgi:hypothetical protein
LDEAWHRAAQLGAVPVQPAHLDFVNWPLTVQGVSVGAIVRDVRADGGPRPLTLIAWHKGLLLICEFPAEKAPQDVRVGDTVSIRSAAGWVEREREWVLLKDCEMIGGRRHPVE